MSEPRGVRYPVVFTPAQLILGGLIAPVKFMLLIIWLFSGMFLMIALSTLNSGSGASYRPGVTGWRRALARSIARGTLILMGVRLSRTGRLPESLSFLISNHLGWLDAVVYMAEAGAVFVSKADVRQLAGLGVLVRSFGTLFIDRRSLRSLGRVSELLGRAVDSGDVVMIFPEADTSNGSQLLPFRPALLQIAVDRRIPVHSAVLHYRVPEGWPAAGALVAWADWTPIFSHIFRLLFLPWIQVDLQYPGKGVIAASRTELSARLREEVLSVFQAHPGFPADASG